MGGFSVAIVGAGALGCVYGARLARFGGCDVSVIAREAGPRRTERLERVDDGEVLVWDVPDQVTTPPAGTDVILVFVRYEQLPQVPARVAGSAAPVVMMTPMMPQDHEALSQALPGRLLTGMPSVVSYRNGHGATRYWLPRAATTRLEPGSHAELAQRLVERLTRAEISAAADTDVLGRNVATTVSFVPLTMALDVAGSIDSLLEDHGLLALALDATEEGRELGRTVGKAEAWASLLLRFVGPHMLRMGVGLARSRAPEAVAYVEEHFGRKLHAQNVAMAARMVELAASKGVPTPALRELLARLSPAA